MILKKSTIERMHKVDWGIHHIFWRFYLVRKYSQHSSAIGRHIWTVCYMEDE